MVFAFPIFYEKITDAFDWRGLTLPYLLICYVPSIGSMHALLWDAVIMPCSLRLIGLSDHVVGKHIKTNLANYIHVIANSLCSPQ